MSRILQCFYFLPLLGGLVTYPAFATTGPGSLVDSFGDGGTVSLNTGFFVDAPDRNNGTPFNKVLAMDDGTTLLAGPGALVKLKRDGTRDFAFGLEGIAAHRFYNVGGLVIDSEGSILVLGDLISRGNKARLWQIDRYSAEGQLDATFTARMPKIPGIRPDRAMESSGLLVQPDGRLLAIGFAFYAPSASEVIVTRWLPNGKLDPSFGTADGTFIARTFQSVIPSKLILQRDGKPVISGQIGGCDDFGCAWSPIVLRLTSAGIPDSRFGTDGWAQPSMNGYINNVQVAQTGDDSLVISTSAFGPFVAHQVRVARLTPSGAVDPTFGENGLVELPVNMAADSIGLAVQPNGRLIVGATRPAGTNLEKDNFLALGLTAKGELDRSFGKGGLATADFGLGPDRATAISMDSRGAVTFAGVVSDLVRNRYPTGVIRFTPDGQPDVTFSDDGRYDEIFNPAAELIVGGLSLPGGRTLLFGAQLSDGVQTVDPVFHDATSRLLAVALDANGRPDSGFGRNGVWSYSFGDARFQRLTAAAMTGKTGKILLGGAYAAESAANVPEGPAAVLIRVNPNGSFDETYGDSGRVLFGATPLYNQGAIVTDIHANRDGSALVLTTSAYGNAGGSPSLWRIDATGRIDTDFGPNGAVTFSDLSCFPRVGVVILAFVNRGECRMAVLPDGRILLSAGSNTGVPKPIHIIRLNPNGEIDKTFGEDGVRKIAFYPESRDSVGAVTTARLQVLPGGNILVGGAVTSPFGAGWDVAFARLLPDGRFDPSFSDDGKVVINFGTTEDQIVTDFARQADGTIVFAGTTTKGRTGTGFDYYYSPFAGRLTENGELDRRFHGGAVRLDDGTKNDAAFTFASILRGNKLVTAGLKRFQEPTSFWTCDLIAAQWWLKNPKPH